MPTGLGNVFATQTKGQRNVLVFELELFEQMKACPQKIQKVSKHYQWAWVIWRIGWKIFPKEITFWNKIGTA